MDGLHAIREPKGGVNQKIHLNAAARELLTDHPRTDSPYVFLGRDGNQRPDVHKQVGRIKTAAGHDRIRKFE